MERGTMTKKDALQFLGIRAWSMYKPDDKGKVVSKDGTLTNGAIFSGVQIVCTKDEWREVILALHGGE